MKLLGLDVDDDTALILVESIDLDHSGEIDVHEFSAWMAYKVSWTKIATIVGKILLGLGQVVSRQPELMKEEYPGPQWESNLLRLFKMDFGWVK